MSNTPKTELDSAPLDTNTLIAERKGKLASLRASGVAYPND